MKNRSGHELSRATEYGKRLIGDLSDRLTDSKKYFWLYVVFNCATQAEIHIIQDPARLGWKPIVKVEHYHVGAKEILKAEKVHL